MAEEARRRAEALEAAQDKDVRRLRARVEQLEAELAAQRREDDARGPTATRRRMRARLLLDTVVDAAAGLRRELALPAVPAPRPTGSRPSWPSPSTSRGRRPRRARSGRRAPPSSSSCSAMPRARLLVDGYNVSKSAWGSSSLEEQRQRLLRGLAPLVARTGAETTVVFDAGRT